MFTCAILVACCPIYQTNFLMNVPQRVADRYLFAVTDATQCAENLPYGPNSITESSSPYVSTQFRSMLHDMWQQVLTTSAGTTLLVTWQFSNVKTLEERFQTAVTSGEAVSWTIRYSADGSTYSKSGTWRYSDGAGDMLARFAS